MADPLKQGDLEDVLASIRRLVASDGTATEPLAPARATNNRLVLTPALRVQSKSPAPDPEDATQAEDAPVDPEEDVAAATDQPPEPAQDVEHSSDKLRRDIASLIKDVPDEGAEASEPSFDGVAPDVDDTPDTSNDEVAPVDLSEIEGMAAAEDIDAVEGEGPEIEEAPFIEQPEEAHIADVAAFSPVEDTHSEPEPEETPLENPVGAADEAGATEEDDEDEDDEEELLMDEDALRDLVAEIVRDELKGTLGETITRNVRKLVRREIRTALLSQTLD